MSQSLSEIIQKFSALQDQIDEEIKERAEHFRYELKNRRVIFDQEVVRAHKEFRIHVAKYLVNSKLLSVVTAPVIYSIVIPFLLLDLFASLYQAICFPVYGIPKVRRSDYIVFDRHKLAYLNILEKFNCIYCSYGNGLLAYAQEISSRTEAYWCPIKHAQRIKSFLPRYADFSDYGSAETYHEDLRRNRENAQKSSD